MNTSRRPDAKITIQTDEQVESLWAFSVGENLFKLDNLPWFAYDVSAEDVVEAIPPAEGALPAFVRVASKSGNRTLRLILETEVKKGSPRGPILEEILNRGGTYEGANGRYFAVNIPPAADFEGLCHYLTEAGVTWEHGDPSYETLYGEPPPPEGKRGA